VSVNKLKIFAVIVVAETYKSEYISLFFLEHKECVGEINFSGSWLDGADGNIVVYTVR
jgi:hypothetical protein